MERIKQALNERLVHLIDKTLFLDYVDPTPENRELNLNVAERGYKGGFLTRNESRGLLGYGEADEGGNEYLAPSGGGGLLGLAVEEVVTKAASDIRDDEINEEEDQMETKWEGRLRQERDNLIKYLEEV